MADRSVRVRLDADVKGFQAGMRTAVKASEDFGKRATGYIDKHRASINDLSNVALGAGSVLTGFAGFAVKSAADFDEAMSQVQAGSMETAGNMDLLRQAALDAGESTVYSATESADAIEQLAKAGLTTADILGGGLAGALDLAASGGIEVGEAAEIASVAMKQFGLEGQDVVHIADLLAAGAGKAVGDVDDLGNALNQAGTVADSFGLSVDETVGGLAAFAEAGMVGSDAGTMLKTMLQQLGNPTEKAKGLMEDLGISVYDANGEFVGLDGVAGELETAFQGMDMESRNAAMGVIFGADAVRGANVLYAEGEQGIRDWNAAVNDQGYAAEQARIRLDNLKGDLEELGGALETAFIGAGEGADGPLRELTQTATGLIGIFNDLGDEAKQNLGTGAGIAGISLLAVGGLGKIVGATADLRGSLNDLGIATDGVGRKFKLLGVASGAGLAIAGLTMALGAFAQQAATVQNNAESLAQSFDDLTGAATADTDTIILEQLNESISAGDWDELEKIGYSYADVVNAIKDGGPAYDQLWNDIERTRIAANTWTEAGKGQSKAMHNTADALRDVGPAYRLAAEQQAEMAAGQSDLGDTAEQAAAKEEILEGSIVDLDGAIKGTVEAMQEMLELMFQSGLITMSARDAQAAFHESVESVGDTVKSINEDLGGMGAALDDAGTDFDLATEAGRTANDAFQEVARSGMDLASSMAEAGASQTDIQNSLDGTYEDLVTAAGQFGITGDAAEDLAREVMGVPEGISIETWMSDEAERQAGATKAAIDGIPRQIRVSATLTYYEGNLPANARRAVPSQHTAGFAEGGFTGHGGRLEPAGIVHRGEWVTTKEKTSKYRPVLEAIHAGTYALPGYANGGPVGGGMVLPYEPRRQQVTAAASGVTMNNQFHNYNTDAVRSTREQVAQFGQKVDSMAVPLP